MRFYFLSFLWLTAIIIGTNSVLAIQPILVTQDSCDIIIMMDGRRVKASNIEVEQKIIRYVKCDVEVPAKIVVDKKAVFRIDYLSGKHKVYTESKKLSRRYPELEPGEDLADIREGTNIGFLVGLLAGSIAIIFNPLAGLIGLAGIVVFLFTIKSKQKRRKVLKGALIGVGIIALILVLTSIF